MEYLTLKNTNLFKSKLIFSLVYLVLLSGCKSVGPDYVRPQLAVPENYSESTDQTQSKVSNTWWTQYQDSLLNNLVVKALQSNSNIKLSAARIEEANAAANEIGAATFPQVDLNAGASRSRVTELGGNPVITNPRSNYKAQLGTSFEIDFWGKLSRSKESARAQVLSSRYAKDTVALTLSGLVVTNYLTLRSLDLQIEITQNNIKSRETSLSLTKRRLDGGVASALDVYQAEVASDNLKAQLVELTRLRSLSLHQLAILTGDLSLNITIADIQSLPVPPTPPAGLPSSLLEARPDVAQAEQQMIAANANIGVAKAALYPTISLTAGLGGESLELSNILKSAARIWSGGVSLYLPIFDSGKVNSKIDQASAKQKQALASYEGVVQNAFTEVNDALVNLRQNTERENVLNSSQIAAKKALEVAENRYKSGYSAYLEVLDAQRVYNDSALSYAQSSQARLVSSVGLFKALGGGWQAESLKQSN
jgi:multidrug efflux system outer membrane protein